MKRVLVVGGLCALAVVALGASPAAAQRTASLVGRVVEESSGNPLRDATVLVEGAGVGSVTDAEGRFRIRGVPTGPVTVVAERLGFATGRARVRVAPGERVELTLALSGDAVSIPAMVVTATREARRLDEVAATVGVIGRSEIEETQPTHPSELMGKIPGVWVNVTGGEGHMTAIRQPLSTDPLYLYLEDGIPTRSTGFFNHNALYEINVPQAERVEVMKGPANALYGSDAIGGVINVQTRAPTATTTQELSLEGGEHGFARVTGSVSGTVGENGLRLDGNFTRTDGWRDGTAYDRWSGTVRWDRSLGDGISMKSVASYSWIDQGTAGSSALSREDYENAPEVNYTPISWRRVTALRLSTELEKRGESGALSLTPYVRSNSMDLLPNWSLTFDPAIWETQNLSFGFLAKYRRDLPVVGGQVIVGIDADLSPGAHAERAIEPVREGKIFTAYETGEEIYDYDVTFRQASPYVHAELAPVEALRVTGGVRLDLLGYDYENHLSVVQAGPHRRPADATPDYAAVSPKLGVTWRLSEAAGVFGAYRRGFRAPSEGQLFRQGSAESTVDLDPIRSDAFEAGVRGGLGSRIRYELSAYHQTMTDDIVGFRLPDGRTENVNAGETLHRGVELGLGVLLVRDLRLDVAWSVAEHVYEEWTVQDEVELSGNEMEAAPNTIGNVDLSWTPAALPGLGLALGWSHLGPYWMDAQNENEYEGHDLFSARASYDLPGGSGIFLRVSNLTDERYAERASFNEFRGQELAPGLPRTLYAGVRIR